MVIGAFFSEVGAKLLDILSGLDPDTENLQRELASGDGSPAEEYEKLIRWVGNNDYTLEAKNVDWEDLKTYLAQRRDFLLRLLENPSLLEHEKFTGVLRAVFHLAEELEARADMRGLPDEDFQHLHGDMRRVYRPLAHKWLDYMKHLKSSYPYLFSLAMRTNPFNRNASPVLGRT
ncbi:MAG: hypothetical protein V1800_03275 [Candidatus Latescibacterota bacterium]